MTLAHQPKSLFLPLRLGIFKKIPNKQCVSFLLGQGMQDIKTAIQKTAFGYLKGEADIEEAYLRTAFSLDFNFERTSATES